MHLKPIPDRDAFDSLIDPERLLVVPKAVKAEQIGKIEAEAKKLGLDRERESRLAHPRHDVSRDGTTLRIHQDLRIAIDDCEWEPDGTLVLRQELRFDPGSRAKHRPRRSGPLTQTDRQIWLIGHSAAAKAGALRKALADEGIAVATSYAYRSPRRPRSTQRYAADPWRVSVKFADECDRAGVLKVLEDLLKIEDGKGPWFQARVLAPDDMYDFAMEFRRRVKGQARLSFRSVPLELPLAAVPPEAAPPGRYSNQKPNFDLIRAEQMWSSVQAFGVGALQPVTIFLVDCGVFESADIVTDRLRNALIDCPLGGGAYENGCTPLDDDPHGTKMAGIAAATWTGVGIAGLAGLAVPAKIKLVSLRCTKLSEVQEALAYAASHLAATKGVVLMGVELLQLYADAAWCPAFEGEAEDFSAALTTATTTNDLFVVAPSGNYDTADPEDSAEIPLPNPTNLLGSLIVGACNAAGTARWVDLGIHKGSRYGPALSLVAPGASVYSTTGTSTYGSESGTSFATAHAGGVAALMRAIRPGLSPTVLKTRMTLAANVGPAPPVASIEVGAGRLNGFACVEAAKVP